MKNPFRKTPLTADTIKGIRERGLDPYTRVLLPLGRKRALVLIGSTDLPKPDPVPNCTCSNCVQRGVGVDYSGELINREWRDDDVVPDCGPVI